MFHVCLQSISVGAEYQADLPDLVTSTDPAGQCMIMNVSLLGAYVHASHSSICVWPLLAL